MSGDPLGILTPKKSFASNDPLGILSTPKKEQPAIPGFMDIGGQTQQTIQTAQQKVPKVQQQPITKPKQETGVFDVSVIGQEVKPTAPINKGGLPIGVAVGKDKKKEGSTLGGIYNTLVGSFARFGGGLAQLGTDLVNLKTGMPYIPGKGVQPIYDSEENRAATEGFIEKARTVKSTKQQEQSRSNFDLTDGISASDVEALAFQAPSQLLDLTLGALSYGSSFFIQAINDNAKELEQNPNADKLSEQGKLGYVYLQASAQSALDAIGLGGILKGTGLNKLVTKKIANEITDELVAKGGKATAKQIQDLAIKKASQLSSKIKRVGLGTATGFALEGGTEGVQEAAQKGIKLLTNKLAGQEIFDEQDIRTNFVKDVINNAAAGGVFGSAFGTGMAALNNTNKSIRRQIAQANKPEDLQRIADDINTQIEQGNLTPQEGEQALQKAQQYTEIATKIPAEIDEETKYDVIGGIDQRNGLQAEIDRINEELKSVDPAFAKQKQDQLALLQDKLAEVNDYIQVLVTGEKPKYAERNGKYFKIDPATDEEIEITKGHYELANAADLNIDNPQKRGEPEEISQPIELQVPDEIQETQVIQPKANEGTITESESIERRLPESEREVEPITTETESIAETKPIEPIQEEPKAQPIEQADQQPQSIEPQQPTISETNPALRDVESTAKALDGSSLKGIVFADKNGVEKIVVQDNKGGGFLIKNNDGKPQNPTMGNHKDISEAYHKAKANGSNPELVAAVENLLSKTQPQEPIIAETQETTIKEQQGKVDTGAKKLADKVRKLKIDLSKLSDGGLQSNPLGLPVAVWNSAMDIVANVIEKGGDAAEAIKRGLNYIQKNHRGQWNKKQFNDEVMKELGVRGITVNGEDFIIKNDPKTEREFAETVNGWYSDLEQSVLDVKAQQGSGRDWMKVLNNSDEAKWTGLNEWLSEQKGSVSKKDIINYLKDNRIEIVEVVKKELSKEESLIIEERNAAQERGEYDKVEEYDRIIEKEIFTSAKPKFSQYQLEGQKENYKEVLVTMPNRIPTYGEYQKMLGYPGNSPMLEKQYLNEYGLKNVTDRSNNEFKSSHFDEKNILVHLRMNTRTDAEGNKTIFLEEIQSDWGQKGKKEGFGTPKYTTKDVVIESNGLVKIGNDNNSRNYFIRQRRNDFVVDSTSGITVAEFDNLEKAKEFVVDKENKRQEQLKLGVPLAPFVTDTNAWTKLALKVALKEAVKQGATKIAWTTGTQQFDRWGSEEIHWRKNTTRTPQEEARMKELGEKIVNYKDTSEERVEHEKLARKEGGFSLLIKEQTSGATAFNGQEIGNNDDVTIQTKEDLRKAIKRNLSRERNETEIDKLTDRIWNRMQTEDSGTSLPRKEGMEGFYGVPSENKLGIVGNVAKSLFKQEPKAVKMPRNNEWVVTDNREIVKSFKTEKEAKKYAKENGLVAEKNIQGLETTQHSIDITPELKQEAETGLPLFKDIKGRGKEIADLLRKGKIKIGGLQSNIAGIPIALYNAAIETIATAIEKGASLTQAINQAIKKHKLRDQKDFNQAEFISKLEEATGEKFTESQPPPPSEPPVSEQGEGKGFRHADTEKIRERSGLEPYQKIPETIQGWIDEARQRIKDGYNVEALLNRVEKGVMPDAVEQNIIGEYLMYLDEQVKANPSDENIAKLKRVVEISDKVGGSEIAKSLVARRGSRLPDDSLGNFFIQQMEATGANVLTENQKQVNTKEFEEIQAANNEYKEKVKILEEEVAKLKAQKEIDEVRKKSQPSKTKKTHEDYVKERQDIIKQMREDLLKVAKGSGGLQSSIPGAAQLKAIAPHVGKLVKSLVDENYTKLEEVVKLVYNEVKDIVEGITEKDIQNIIAGDYSEKKQTRSNLAANLRDLKTEAKLLGELEKLQNGVEPKVERQKQIRNKRITDLQNQIKELRKQQYVREKEFDKFYTEDLDAEFKKLAALRKRTESEIAKVEEKIKKGDFAPEERKPLLLNPELKKKYPEEFKKAVEAKDKLIKLKQEREIRLLKEKYANRTKYQKIQDAVVEVSNVPRAIMASVDFSAPLRQGIITTVAYPTISMKAAAEMFKQAFSQKAFDRWFYDVKEHPRYELAKKSTLHLADPHDPKLSAKEEQFMSNLAEKIPVIGRLVKGSERAYIAFLNKVRWDVFNRMADAYESEGKTFENSEKLYRETGDYINTVTGRGTLGKFEESAQVLNAAFFSPRLIASRVKLLTNFANPNFYYNVPKEVRVQYFKDMAKFLGAGLSVLTLAKLYQEAFGSDEEDEKVTVEVDPRSSDFGKIKVGNTRYDIWGGFQPYVRLMAQMFTGQRKTTTTGEIQNLQPRQKFETAAGFFRGKLAPVPASGVDIITGETVTGDRVQPLEELTSMLIPLTFQDLSEAIKDKGVSAIFTTGVPSTFGVGTQTYTNISTLEGLYDRNLTSKQTMDINKITKYENGVKKPITKDEFKKFTQKRDSLIKSELDELYKNGKVYVKDGKPIKKTFADMTTVEVQDEIKKIKTNATKQAKEELFPVPLNIQIKEDIDQSLEQILNQ